METTADFIPGAGLGLLYCVAPEGGNSLSLFGSRCFGQCSQPCAHCIFGSFATLGAGAPVALNFMSDHFARATSCSGKTRPELSVQRSTQQILGMSGCPPCLLAPA